MAEHFDFEVGDVVVVRIREHAESGHLRAKFVAEVERIHTQALTSESVVLNPPWDALGGIQLKYYEAEFEVVESKDAVSF